MDGGARYVPPTRILGRVFIKLLVTSPSASATPPRCSSPGPSSPPSPPKSASKRHVQCRQQPPASPRAPTRPPSARSSRSSSPAPRPPGTSRPRARVSSGLLDSRPLPRRGCVVLFPPLLLFWGSGRGMLMGWQDFMTAVSLQCKLKNHHPEWSNVGFPTTTRAVSSFPLALGCRSERE